MCAERRGILNSCKVTFAVSLMRHSLKESESCQGPVPGVEKKKKNHYISSSHFRADQMPGPQREGLSSLAPNWQMQSMACANRHQIWHQAQLILPTLPTA